MDNKKYFAYQGPGNRIKDRQFSIDDATRFNRENPGQLITLLHYGFDGVTWKWDARAKTFKAHANALA